MIVQVVPYNPDWPGLFKSEKIKLERVLGDVAVQIDHIGSTSVPGLSAKPIIDILMEVVSVEALDEFNPAFVELGYEVMGEYGIAGRRYFRKGGEIRTHHIHAFGRGDPNLIRHLAFRDYLIAHPQVLIEYQALKVRLAAEHRHDIEGYCDGKDGLRL